MYLVAPPRVPPDSGRESCIDDKLRFSSTVNHDRAREINIECQRYGKHTYADYGAVSVRQAAKSRRDFATAKHIVELYLRRGHQPSRGGSVSQYALTSGPTTPSEGRQPSPVWVKRRGH